VEPCIGFWSALLGAGMAQAYYSTALGREITLGRKDNVEMLILLIVVLVLWWGRWWLRGMDAGATVGVLAWLRHGVIDPAAATVGRHT